MSLIKKISGLFTKETSNHCIGINTRQHAVAFCYLPEEGKHLCETIEKNTLASGIRALKSEYKLQGRCQLVLSPEQYKIIQVDKPNVPEEEINAALKWQIKDLVPYAPDNMVLDYFSGPVLAGGAEKINVVCAALDELKTTVDSLLELDFVPESITTPEFAFASLVAEESNACLMVCQQPNEELLVLIVSQGRLFFHRQLRGFTQIASRTQEDLVASVVDSISLEIQRSTDYFERQLKQAPIRSVKVVVPMNNESFLVEKLAANTNVPVEVLAMPEGFENQRYFASVIGATMKARQGVTDDR